VNDKRIKKMGDGRVTVPLVMLDGNMAILLENEIPCQSISLRWSEEHAHAVVLVVHGADKEKAAELGFKLRSVS
jgi:hypothetical protein